MQAIQSTPDGINCKQEILINGLSIWSRSLRCPQTLTSKQLIYLSGDYSFDASLQVRNFQFLTHPV